MRRMQWVLLLAALGCSTDEATLVVQLRTDLSPGSEFDRVDVTVASEADPIFERSDSAPLTAAAPVSTGVRVAELRGLTPGYYRVRVELFSGDVWVAGTETSPRVRGVWVETVQINRGCTGVTACVTRECPPEILCAPAAPCAIPTCQPDGACQYVLDHDRCPTGFVCDAVLGCRAPDGGMSMPDGGASVDAGPTDGGPGVCAPGRADCNGAPGDGCETDLSSPTSCGGCGSACLPGEFCVVEGGFYGCLPTCSLTDCGGSCVDTSTDVNHCGGCDQPCMRANATATCTAGVCAIETCNPGFDDCNGSDGDGCETPIGTDTDCGGCGIACIDHLTATIGCTAGSCAITACIGSTADCDGLITNGCEMDVWDDEANCGACGYACSAAQRCQATACCLRPPPAGLANCDRDRTNGCETDTSSSVDHCGDCNRSCADLYPQTIYNGERFDACVAGSCSCTNEPGGVVCGSTQLCCPGIGGNYRCHGDNDTSHCGGCGVACGPGETCNNGRCCCGGCRAVGAGRFCAAGDTCSAFTCI